VLASLVVRSAYDSQGRDYASSPHQLVSGFVHSSKNSLCRGIETAHIQEELKD
jgi:hypothetical protein